VFTKSFTGETELNRFLQSLFTAYSIIKRIVCLQTSSALFELIFSHIGQVL